MATHPTTVTMMIMVFRGPIPLFDSIRCPVAVAILVYQRQPSHTTMDTRWWPHVTSRWRRIGGKRITHSTRLTKCVQLLTTTTTLHRIPWRGAFPYWMNPDRGCCGWGDGHSLLRNTIAYEPVQCNKRTVSMHRRRRIGKDDPESFPLDHSRQQCTPHHATLFIWWPIYLATFRFTLNSLARMVDFSHYTTALHTQTRTKGLLPHAVSRFFVQY